MKKAFTAIAFSLVAAGIIAIVCIVVHPGKTNLDQADRTNVNQERIVLGCDYILRSEPADKLCFSADGKVSSQKFNKTVANEEGFADWYGSWAYSETVWSPKNKNIALMIDEAAVSSKIFFAVKEWCIFAKKWQVPYNIYIVTTAGVPIAIESCLFLTSDAVCFKIHLHDATKAFCLNNQSGNGFMLEVSDAVSKINNGDYDLTSVLSDNHF